MPLNLSLYNKLEQLFGTVRMANEGIEGLARNSRRPGGGQYLNIVDFGESYRVNCPFCNDTRQRLWINWRYGQPDPASNGQFRNSHACKCFNEDCISGSFEKRRKLADMILSFQNVNQRHQQWVTRRGEVRSMGLSQAPPPGRMWRMTQMNPNDPVYRYMTETRRYTHEMLDHYNVSYCEQADPRFSAAQGRVIFPIIYDGVTVGWQGRWPADGLNWGELNIPKYYTMPGMRKGQILYNYDNAKDKPFVIVCEGVTDVHAVGDHAVAVLGKAISSTQRQRLLTTWRGKPILLLLDPDARREMEGMLAEMMHIQVSGGGAMFPVVLPDGRDPADYDRVTIQAIIQARAREVGVSLAGS
jgi:hypothetical protein